jgi:GH15 family glucan-1,4-alpha-glucosidase
MENAKNREEKGQVALSIEDYALIGDCETAALVGIDGSIDWLCWPDFSSPACFAALLGTKDNGRWLLAPREPVKKVSRRYRDHTLILETTFETSSGVARLTDFMPIRDRHSDVVRIVRCMRGRRPSRWSCLRVSISAARFRGRVKRKLTDGGPEPAKASSTCEHRSICALRVLLHTRSSP